MINIVCTSKPGDGLLRYSYEHNCALNSLGIKTQLVIIPNPDNTNEDYIKSIKDQYKTYENIIFNDYTPTTNEIYYKEIEKVIHKYPDHGIVTYNKKWINPKLNNLFAPIENILGKFETYVYTKPNFDPAPRLFVEFKWLGKNVEYVRDKNIKDGGMVYWNRPLPSNKIYKDNISILVNTIKTI